MDNQEFLAIIKQVRNIFDTIGVESEMASRNIMDMWAEILLSGNKAMVVSFAYNIQNRVYTLKSLLYSINKMAEDILKAYKAELSVQKIKFIPATPGG